MNAYLKSPLNYVGGKHKLLPQLLPCFPTEIGTFVDLFAGGCNVGINVTARTVVCRDISHKVIEIYRVLQDQPVADSLAWIDGRIAEFELSSANEAGYLRFRAAYNSDPKPLDLYALLCFAFNNQLRFNNSLQFNGPFGRDRSHFTHSMRSNLVRFVQHIQAHTFVFQPAEFQTLDLAGLTPSDLIYCDPPYLISTGSYNDGNRGFKDWDEAQEATLLTLLDQANSLGLRFTLSNVLEHKGQANRLLQTWATKYRVTTLRSDYSNCNYHAKDRHAPTHEVVVTNYDRPPAWQPF